MAATGAATDIQAAHDPRAGLSSEAALAALAEHGQNVLAEAEPPHWLLRFARNLTHLFALLLWAGAALAIVGGLPELSAAIVAVIVINAVFSFVQEYRAERAVAALGRILPHQVRVRRDGRQTELRAEDIVPGDLVVLSAGDRVPADAQLVWDARLKVDMSTLTGESKPVWRRTGSDDGGEGIEAVDRVFAGTYVASGAAEAVVATTGMRTELGRITSLTAGAERHDSPLELEMRRVTRVVALLSVSLGAAFFLLAGSLGMGATERFLFAIGVIVANVPEGLLPTVTLSLALATQRMARRNAIVRRLSAVETLGETTVICTDKTGTLTENQMTVTRVWLPSGELDVDGTGYSPAGGTRVRAGAPDAATLEELARAGALCNDAGLERDGDVWRVVGDPTEGALLTLARKVGLDLDTEARSHPRVHVEPFDSVSKRMTTVNSVDGAMTAYVKGSPGAVLSCADLAPGELARAREAADALARASLRVLALARRSLGGSETLAADEPLEFLGLVGMEDPPRPEAGEAIERCRRAGIRVVMVTGDHPATAEAIARETGLLSGRARVLQSADLERLDDAALLAELERPDVLVARVTPEQKLRIARTLRSGGEVVAMTGDGVNDAPALREADIGIAMGRGGTDVAREASDLLLVDDNFASIAAAVEEGRAVYDNIRRFAQYHFSSNVAELFAFLLWGLSGGAIPLPLVVMQVLAIDLGTDLLPAIALGMERAEPGVMNRPPRPRSERLLNLRVLARVYGFVGLVVGFAGMTSFLASYWLAGWRPFDALPDSGSAYVQATAMTYAGIVAGQVGAGFAFRADRRSVFSIGLFSNRFLLVGIAFEIALLLAIIYLPPLQRVFHTQAVDPRLWLVLAIWPVLVLGAEEARKAAFRRWVWPRTP
jgi:Ca2+-transporting ATPase